MGYQMPIFLMLTTIKIIVLEVITSIIRPHALIAFPSFPPNRPISCAPAGDSDIEGKGSPCNRASPKK